MASTRMFGQRRWLVLLLLACTGMMLFVRGDSSKLDDDSESEDVAGAASSTSALPFPVPLPLRESHISSERHADSLLHTPLLDTSDLGHSVWDALARREETRSFAEWIERACEEDGSLLSRIRATRVWTLFVPSNDDVASYLSSYGSNSLPPQEILLGHLVPNQSFVLYERASQRLTPLLTAARESNVSVCVCDTDSVESCAKEAESDEMRRSANMPPGARRSFLLRQEVLWPNRVAADGVIHIVGKVLRPENDDEQEGAATEQLVENNDAAEPQQQRAPATISGDDDSITPLPSPSPSAPSTSTPPSPPPQQHPRISRARELPPPQRIDRPARKDVRHGIEHEEDEDTGKERRNATNTQEQARPQEADAAVPLEAELPQWSTHPHAHHTPHSFSSHYSHFDCLTWRGLLFLSAVALSIVVLSLCACPSCHRRIRLGPRATRAWNAVCCCCRRNDDAENGAYEEVQPLAASSQMHEPQGASSSSSYQNGRQDSLL